jgi:lipopolysaccharide/colanic/teichoic acid biosynthesis glycosyltransferase
VFRKAGCEWAWRLMQEPRRLFLRYVVGNPVFLASAVGHALAVREAAARWSLVMKRWFDRAVAGLALALLSPLFAMIALAIWGEDRGPVFFRQTRIGAFGKPFRIWKFRSMVVDAEARLAMIRAQSERGGNFKMKDDPRITRVGRFLRRTSLDELPQLINVLRGQMSIVGPRPSLPGEVVGHDGAMLERLKGLPGITCTWQVSGRANVSFEQQVALDVDYLKERSLWGDLLLICRTIPAVIMARGAY